VRWLMEIPSGPPPPIKRSNPSSAPLSPFLP
jgi:hypothetical protein